MKKSLMFFSIATVSFLIVSCGGNDDKQTNEESAPIQSMVEEKADPMDNKGVGPITDITLSDEVDKDLAAKGLEVYTAMCTACHKAETKYIGPSPKGILDRRSPEWVMNMILNPEQMVKEDPIAKALLVEYNMSPMANQNLTEEEARAVLEYFRTL